jgi:hypothetical protein
MLENKGESLQNNPIFIAMCIIFCFSVVSGLNTYYEFYNPPNYRKIIICLPTF